jgi:polysaccharide biosynthesis transport protein
LRQDVERARMVELKLTRELEEKTNSATSAAPKYLRATELGPEIDSLQKSLEAIDNRIRDLDLESSSPGSIHVSTKAQTPASPERSKLPIFALAVLMISLTIATAVPVGMDLLDHRIYTPHDVEHVVGFHPIGVLVDEDQFPGEVAGEYYFRLAAGIDHAVRSSGARIFLFTSAAHGAGTSTVVRKLSEQLRNLNLRTRTMTAAASSELDLLSSDDAPLPHNKWNRPDDVLQSPSTPIAYNHPRHQLERDVPPPNWVEQTLNRAAMDYDVVLIDAQPMPVSAQTEYLARLADATVLVVKARGTTKQDLECTARVLERLEVAGVAVILNKVRVDRADGALKKALRSYEKSFTEPSVIPKAEPEPKLTTA